MKKISFIVLTYNSEKYLKKCLDAIIQNSSSEDELLIIDNNSSDKTKTIIREYSKIKNVRTYFLDKNIFISDGRNLGAKLAKNNLLAFIDSDIILEENSIKLARKNFKKIAAMIGLYYEHGTGFNWYVETIREVYAKKRKKGFKKEITYQNFTTFSGGLCIIKKDVYFKYMGYNNMFDNFPSEDINFELKLIRDRQKIVFEKSFLANHYKGHLTFFGLIKRYYKSGVALLYLMKLSVKEKYFIPFNNQWPYLPLIFPLEIILLIINTKWSFLIATILVLYRIIPILFKRKILIKHKIGTIFIRVILDIVMIYSMIVNMFKKLSFNNKKFNME